MRRPLVESLGRIFSITTSSFMGVGQLNNQSIARDMLPFDTSRAWRAEES